MFIRAVQTNEMCPNNQHIFKALCDMFALHGIVENGREFLHDGYMSSEQMDMARTQVYDLLKVIRYSTAIQLHAFFLHYQWPGVQCTAPLLVLVDEACSMH